MTDVDVSKINLNEVDQARFWDQVDKTGTCWLWQGTKTNGYGRFRLDGKMIRAHRAAYVQTKGVIPEGMVIDHLCHTKECVNPDHLRAVSHEENMWNRLGATKISKSGVRNVTWHKRQRKWCVSVRRFGKVYNGGSWDTLEEAAAAAAALRERVSSARLTAILDGTDQ